MSKHTPGPWKIKGTNTTEGFSGYIVSTADDRGPMPVASIGLCNGSENEANALLIAAAPSLLTALEVIVSQLKYASGSVDVNGLMVPISDIVKYAESFIHKTKGEHT